jgi:hypothetical protein
MDLKRKRERSKTLTTPLRNVHANAASSSSSTPSSSRDATPVRSAKTARTLTAPIDPAVIAAGANAALKSLSVTNSSSSSSVSSSSSGNSGSSSRENVRVIVRVRPHGAKEEQNSSSDITTRGHTCVHTAAGQDYTFDRVLAPTDLQVHPIPRHYIIIATRTHRGYDGMH